MWLQSIQIYFYYLIKIFLRVCVHLSITSKMFFNGICRSCNLCTASGSQVTTHAFIVTKSRSSSANLCTHVTNSSFTSTRQVDSSLAKVFYHRTSTTFHGKNTSHFKNYIFRTYPTIKFSGKSYANYFWHFKFPRQSRHHITSICATNANCNHAKPSSIYRVAISTYHHATRESIIF